MDSRRLCPACRSDDVARSRTRNVFERLLKHALRTVPYRCADCRRRFFRRTKNLEIRAGM